MNLRCSGLLINQYPLLGTMNLEYLLMDPNNNFRSSRTVVYCHYKYIRSVQSRNLHNLEIAQCILRIRKLHANREIAH